MGLRDKMRKTFKKNDGSSSGGSTPSTSSDPSHYTGRTDIEYYKPHEIPKSKYRGKVDPDHQEKLDSYSFGDAFQAVRRRSSQALSGIMSPGGTKSQSRRPSYMSHMSTATKDGRRRSMASAATPGTHDVQDPLSRTGTSAGLRPSNIRENSDDDTTPSNAGLARQRTADNDDDEQTTPKNVPEVRLERQATVADQPFTAAELEHAMSRHTLRADQDGTLRNSLAIAAH